MTSTSKLAAVAVVATLLAQPLLPAPACWQGSTKAAACPGGCSMPHERSKSKPVKAESADPDCCELTSSEPAPWVTLAKGSETFRTLFVVPVTPDRVGVERVTVPVAVNFSPPRPQASSLHTLNCVFLI